MSDLIPASSSFNGGEFQKDPVNEMDIEDIPERELDREIEVTYTKVAAGENIFIAAAQQDAHVTNAQITFEKLVLSKVTADKRLEMEALINSKNGRFTDILNQLEIGLKAYFPVTAEDLNVAQLATHSYQAPYNQFSEEDDGIAPALLIKLVHRMWTMFRDDTEEVTLPAKRRNISGKKPSHVPPSSANRSYEDLSKKIRKQNKKSLHAPRTSIPDESSDSECDTDSETITPPKKVSDSLALQIDHMDLETEHRLSSKELKKHRECLAKLAQAQATQFAKSLYDPNSMGGVKFTRKSHDITLPIFKQKFMQLINNLKKNHRDGYELLCIDYNGKKSEYLTTERLITCINLHIEIDTLSHITEQSDGRILRGDSTHTASVDKYFNFIFEICQESTRLLSSIEASSLTLKRSATEPVSVLIAKIEQLHTNNQSVSMDCRLSEKQMRQLFISALSRSDKIGDQGRSIYLTQHLTSEIPWHVAVEWVYKADALPDNYCLSQMKGMIMEDGKIKSELPTLPPKSSRKERRHTKQLTPNDSASQISSSTMSKDELFHQKHKKWSPSMANCTYCHGPHLNFHCPKHPKTHIAEKNVRWATLQKSIREKREAAAGTSTTQK